MYLEEISSQDYKSFLEGSTQRYFYNQTDEAINADSCVGRKILRVGLKDAGVLVAVAKINQLCFKRFFISQELHFGPILDSDRALLSDFIKAWQKFATKNWQVIRLRFTPPANHFVIINENTAETLFPTESATVLAELQQLGFSRLSGDFYNDQSAQPRFHYVKDISGFKSVMEAVPTKTRNHIRRANKLGVKVRFLAPEEIGMLNDFLKMSMQRHNLSNNLISLHKPSSKNPYGNIRLIPMAYLNPKESLADLHQQKETLEKEYMDIKAQPESKKRDNQLIATEKNLVATEKRISDMEELAKIGEEIPLAASEFYFTPSDAIYLQSGMNEKYRHFNGVYAIHEAMLQEAINRGCKYYNFFGIQDPRKTIDGVTEFKENFNGEIHEYLGTFEYFPGLGKLLKPLLKTK